jgi:NitT/TauT family transport system substrate-binding protein
MLMRLASRRRWAALLVIVMSVVLGASGCGLLGDDNGSAPAQGAGDQRGVRSIKVAVSKSTDLAPFHLAIKNGYFKDAGLDIDPTKGVVTVNQAADSIQKLVGGEVDIAYGTYGDVFTPQAKGVLDDRGGFKLVADASSAGPGSTMVMAMPTSAVKSIRDMGGRKVAVTAETAISGLLIKSNLKTAGIDYKTIRWVPVPLPGTGAALQSGSVDAAFLVEPFLTGVAKTVGAVPVFDTATGPTADFPTAGYATTGKFADANPWTIATFQRVMEQATNEAKATRSKVEPLLQEFAGVDADTAKLATLLTFQSTLDATRIQRAADLMIEFEVIKKPIKVADMIIKRVSSG